MDRYKERSNKKNLTFSHFKSGAEKLLNELKEKTKYVNWHNDNREEHYAIFAKSFAIKTKQALCIDLKDMNNLLVSSQG